MYRKRVFACIVGGAISALICVSGGNLRGVIAGISPAVLAASIVNRLLIGFVIAISQWRMNYMLHGVVIGLLVSLTVSLQFLPSDQQTFFLYTGAGVVYGVLTEILSTVVFRAPMRIGASAD
jgi:hypothetical protein